MLVGLITLQYKTGLNLFCERPQGRIDGAVSQGLSILAGLALGGSVGNRGVGEP